jgi:hypothetical protein
MYDQWADADTFSPISVVAHLGESDDHYTIFLSPSTHNAQFTIHAHGDVQAHMNVGRV